MKEILLVFTGGGIGSLMRFFLHRFVHRFLPVSFPYGTLTVNITACFLLGWILAMCQMKNSENDSLRLFLAIGICGGFSTFSTFSAENIQLLQNGEFTSAFAYIGSSLFFGFLALFAGTACFRFL